MKDIVTGPVSSLGQVDDERESLFIERVVEVVVVVVAVLEQHLGCVVGSPRPTALVKPAHPPGYVDLVVKNVNKTNRLYQVAKCQYLKMSESQTGAGNLKNLKILKNENF